MFECKVCGHEFELKKENRYLSTWQNPIFGSFTLHECFDCPICGCQNIVSQREPSYTDIDSLIIEEGEQNE
jgi:hypothetical protein